MELEEIKGIITSMPHVEEVHHVHVWFISTTENALTAHILIDEALPFAEKLKVVDEIKHRLAQHNIHHSTIELSLRERKEMN